MSWSHLSKVDVGINLNRAFATSWGPKLMIMFFGAGTRPSQKRFCVSTAYHFIPLRRVAPATVLKEIESTRAAVNRAT
jgi:hypothetical protein